MIGLWLKISSIKCYRDSSRIEIAFLGVPLIGTPPPPFWYKKWWSLDNSYNHSLGTVVKIYPIQPLLLICCWLLLPLLDSVIVLCFGVRYFVSILVLQSSRWGRESWLLCFVCLPGVSWLLCGSSSRCHGFVSGSLWLWYFLVILTIFDSLLQMVNTLSFQG